jgi:hypothetical protein
MNKEHSSKPRRWTMEGKKIWEGSIESNKDNASARKIHKNESWLFYANDNCCDYCGND